ncbi:Luciferase-like monooxygenase [Microbacterium sp. cf046]|uniref:LLM class flavin-dependent oxidoreductase n=1 Tax=Microbacterium sp. cf046 TaxID=1761803 RepID=UPI0008EF2CF0|nr:LLM class flavin-dependent oxidoreductase [Microbacterium sp. cf046]SFR92829.1 Luciferase-like monooxygenase [Microbacterium sp. cf046]
MTDEAVVSVGVAASIGPELAALLAPLVEDAGFHALWVNDTPGADALAVIEAAAATTDRLVLATGVLPVDRRTAPAIAAQVAARGLPQDRLMLGIGSGQASTGALQLVADAAHQLRATLSAEVVIGALGPKMRHRAVDESDGVLLSWLTPAVAREQADDAHATRPSAHVALYVRTAVDPAAHEHLETETARYASYPSYAANFARLGIDPRETVLDAARHDLAARLDDYRRGPDEIVLRAITSADTLDEYGRFIGAAAGLL